MNPDGPGSPITVSDCPSTSYVIAVLLVPVLQSCQDYEGGTDVALDFPGQHVPAWAEEPLADPLPRRCGSSVLLPDPDEAAAREAV